MVDGAADAARADGQNAWNAWRRDPANKDVHVIFAGIDFSEAPRDRIDFSGFEFGDLADFSRTETLHHILSVMAQHSGAKMPKLGNSNN
jgi:hypothetical protein